MRQSAIESALYSALKRFGPLERDETVKRLPSKFRFEAMTLLPKLIREQKIIEIRGKCYVPGSAAALAVLRDLSEAS